LLLCLKPLLLLYQKLLNKFEAVYFHTLGKENVIKFKAMLPEAIERKHKDDLVKNISR